MVSGLQAVGATFKALSRTARYSFISIVKGPQKNKRKRSPSKATLEMIEQIHLGFDPICLSAKRWAVEREMAKKEQASLFEELTDVYEDYRKENQRAM